MKAGQFLERACRRMYRALLHSYPPHFRDAYGQEMEETFVDQLREARLDGVIASGVLLLTSTADCISNGWRERIAPQPKGSRMFHWMDVRYAFRLLRRSPMFSLLTVLVLSGGLGLAIFTFSFLHTAMLKPLPVPNGDRIVSIRQTQGTNSGPFDAADLASVRSGTHTLSEVGAYTSQGFVLGSDEHPRVIDATVAEWTVFGFTRTRAALGRTFTREDAITGAEPVIVLSYRLWRAAFGADSSIVGRTVPMNNASTRVIGVMPDGYGFPVASEAWVPLNNNVVSASKFGETELFLYGRLAPGVNAEQAQTEIRLLFKRAREQDRAQATGEQARIIGESNATRDVALQTFPMAQMGDEGPLMLAVLNVLAGLILLLACINVTNLLLARSNERVRETAVRLALGASRARLVMQSMWESVILCVTGGAIATAIAAWGLDAINAWTKANLEGNMAFWWVWGLDRSAIIAAGLFITATIALLGIVVSGRATSLQFVSVLKDGSARSGSRREGRVVRVLVVTQVATVSVLMFFGVLSGIVAYRVANINVGYDTRHLLSTIVSLDGDQYAKAESRNTMFTLTRTALAEAPSISNVMLRSNLGAIADESGTLLIKGVGAATDANKPHAYIQALEGDVSTVGMMMRSGRMFDSRDASGGAPVAIISQALADRYFVGASPIGRQIKTPGDSAGEWRTVIGVSSNIVLGAPFSPTRSAIAIFVPLQQVSPRAVELLFKHRGDQQTAQAALHHTLHTLDAHLLPPDVQSFDEILQKTSLIATSTAKLFAACFAFALLLAVSGTYGLMARNIGQRTREIGVRRALGASDASVVRLLLGQGGRQLGIGVVFSLPLMLLVGLGFGKFFPVGVVTTIGSAVLVGSAIVLVVLLATYVPTRRAVGVELRDALWKE
ncbi:MAG: ABC transporter permease [Gemmatimonadaceae bacterium]